MGLEVGISLGFTERRVSLNLHVQFLALVLQERRFVPIPEADADWIDFRGKGAVHACAFAHAVRTLFVWSHLSEFERRLQVSDARGRLVEDELADATFRSLTLCDCFVSDVH